MTPGTGGDTASPTPYPGLRSFHRSEFDIFFGRDDHVSEMLSKLAKNHFLCITGPSGCGKSSLARTGLFNALEAGFLSGRGSDWIFCDLHPETDPLDRLCAALATAIVLGESGREASEPDPEEAADIAELRSLFHNHIEDRSSNLTGALDKVTLVERRPIVILVDQFEEIFRYAQDDPHAASRFVDVLLKTSAVRRDVYVVITIRTDELEKCARYGGLTAAINHSQFLTPTLDRFQMQEAIEGPASLFNATIDPALSVWMLNGLEEQLDKLPLMQHALRLLYVQARRETPEGHVEISLDDFYEVFEIETHHGISRSNGHDALRTSLSHRLDTLYGRLDEADRRIARGLFCALTTLDSRGRDIRRPIRLGEAEEVLGCDFADLLRVVLTFKEGSESYLRIAGEHDGIDPGDTVDVTHECVLRLWRPLQERWLPEESGAAESLRFLARFARERDDAASVGIIDRLFGRTLLGGNTLKRYSEWWSERRPNPSWASRYLEGIEWAVDGMTLGPRRIYERIEALVQDSKRYASRARTTLTLAALGAVALILGYGWNEVEQEIEHANNERKNAVWQAVSSVNPSADARLPFQVAQQADEALASAAEVGITPENMAVAREKVFHAFNYLHELRRFDHGSNENAQVFAADFLPGGDRIVTLSQGLDLSIWDRRENTAPHVIPLRDELTLAEGKRGRSLAVSSDGTMAVGTQRGGLLLIVNAAGKDAEPKKRELYPGPDEWGGLSTMQSLAFSRSGDRLVAGALTGHLHLWSRDAGGDWQSDDALSASELISKSQRDRRSSDGKAEILEQTRVWSVLFSNDDRMIAAGLGDGRVCLLTPDGAEARCSGKVHSSPVKALAFRPDDRVLLSGGNDDKVRIWDLNYTSASLGDINNRGLPELDLSPVGLWHDSDIWAVDFDAAGQLIVTASWDGSIRLFEQGTWRPLRILRGHEQALRTVQFAPEGTEILSASLDHTARLWTPFTSRLSVSALTARLTETSDRVGGINSVALGPEGDWVAFTDRQSILIKPHGGPPQHLNSGETAKPKINSGDPSDPNDSKANTNGKEPGAVRLPSTLAAPTARDMFVVAMRQPMVEIWERSDDGSWMASILPITGADASVRIESRHIAVSADGARFAVDVFGPDGMAVLVCSIDADRCGSGEGDHLAFVPFAPDVATDRPPGHDCVRGALPTAIALSPAGDRLAVGGSDCNVRLYDLTAPSTDASEAVIMSGHVGNITSLDFSSDGTAIAAASADWQASIWRFESDEVVKLTGTPEKRGHQSSVAAISFLPTGQFAASVSGDERLIVWDTRSGDPVLDYPNFDQSLTALDAREVSQGVALATGDRLGDVVVQHFFEHTAEVLNFAKETLNGIEGVVH